MTNEKGPAVDLLLAADRWENQIKTRVYGDPSDARCATPQQYHKDIKLLTDFAVNIIRKQLLEGELPTTYT